MVDITKVKQTWGEMSPEERDSYANSLSEEQFNQLKTALSAKGGSTPSADISEPDIKAQQQEIIDRMSGEIHETIGQAGEGTGETLGKFATRPDVVRTGLEIGGMFLGGASAPLVATKLLSKAPSMLTALSAAQKASPIIANVALRGAGAAVGGGIGSLMAEPVSPSENPLGRAAETAAFGLAGEGVGGVLAKTGAALAPTMRQGADVAQRVLQRFGGTLTTGEATVPGVGGQLAEGIARSGVTGRQTFKRLTEVNENAIQSAKNDLLDSISASRPGDTRTGKLFVQAIEKGEMAHKGAAAQKYAILDEAGQIPVDVSGVGKHFSQISENLKKLGDVGKTERGGKLIDQLAKVNPNISFKEAHELRSALLATARDLKASGQESIALRNVTSAVKMVEDSMDVAARKGGGDFYKQYREVSQFYKRGKDAFSNEIIRKAVSSNPERIGEYLFRSGNVSEIVQAKAALRQAARYDKSVNADEVFGKMKAGFLESKLTGRGATNVEAETIAKNFLKELAEKKFDRTMSAMFSETERQKIREFAITAMRVSAKKGETSELGVIVPIVQATALVDMVTFQFNNPALDAAVIITPFALSKAVTNPRLVNKMIYAMRTPASSKRGAVLATELAAEFQREEKRTQ